MADRAVGIPIVKEGLPFVGGLAGATLLFGLAGWTIPAVVAGGFTLFTAWFFRNPSRTIPQQPNVVVSSGDGKVIAIEEEFEPRYLKENGIRVTVFLNVFDVHVNRMPCAGTVEGSQLSARPVSRGEQAGGDAPQRAECRDVKDRVRGESALRAGCRADCPPDRLLGRAG